MEIDELLQMKIQMDRLRELDGRPAPEPDGELSNQELRRLVAFLREMIHDLQQQLEEANNTNQRNSEQLDRLYKLVESSQAKEQQLLTIIEKLEAQLAVGKKMHFGSKSAKGIERKQESKGKNEDKDDFDGTAGSLTTQKEDAATGEPENKPSKRSNRKGSTYKTFEADTKVEHKCDRSQLPEGAEIISTCIRKVFDHISLIVEHDFECITYRTKDGKAETRYFPMADDKQAHLFNESVPGTHATPELLSHLAFDCYQLSTPVNREMTKLTDLNFRTCRQTTINWLWKGGEMLTKLIPALKNIALEEGANTNCDETWVRVKTARKYKKHYIWCLVNRARKIVIFFYDEGSRGRNALKDFLGDSRIKSMQTDGYNVYMYLDNEQELIDIEHICCWAHARHKFKLAHEQGSDERARDFLEQIGQLYNLEEQYKADKLTADEIKEKRNSPETCGILGQLACRLNEMLNIKDSLGFLMQKAVNYLHSYWKQLVAWRNDGNYTIDNNASERAVRAITLQRKTSLQFGSSKGVEISAIYHTIIETCKLSGISARCYLKRFFQEMAKGRNDFENLLPATIGKV